LPFAMTRVISKTLEQTIKLYMRDNVIQPPDSYAQLARFVSDLTSGRNVVTPMPRATLAQFSVITFNYDLCLDYAFSFKSLPIQYCLEPDLGDGVRILKLHGSLNWGRCSACNKLVSWPVQDMFKGRTFLTQNGSPIILPLTAFMEGFRHCSSGTVACPYVVPPTWNKAQYHSTLEPVWRAAAQELSEAENIYVCGYSFPETDQFFKYLYALGTVGTARVKRFWVINPNETVEARFRNLLGQAAGSRFKFMRSTLEHAFYELRGACNLVAN
jgi:hypothetical protein